MNTTPNYNFDKTIDFCAIGAIDNDMKRVEDKANKALGFEADLIRAQKDIECLSKQKYNGYSKCETDALLGGKVDKKDGFDLISNDCLHQICSNKDNISLLEQYIRELQEQNISLKDYIETQLINKADIGTPKEYEMLFHEGIKSQFRSTYSKTPFNYVVVSGTCHKENGYFSNTEVIATLPEGFRPRATIEVPGSVDMGDTANQKAGCSFYISGDGNISTVLTGLTLVKRLFFSCVFLAK